MAKWSYQSYFVGCLAFATVACTPVFDPRDSGVDTHHETMRSVALTYGAQSGLAWKADIINASLEDHSDELDQVYNFNALMMKNNMLPPVIQESTNTMNADDYETMRIADREIQIVRAAQLVTAPPTWREYLHLTYTRPEKPEKTLYPRNEEERKIWKTSFEQGWKRGVKQADDIFAQSLGMINRDFNGMVHYHTLLTQNMVSPAYTSKAHLGVTGDANLMRVNDQVLRITESAKLQAMQSDDWHAVVDIHDE